MEVAVNEKVTVSEGGGEEGGSGEAKEEDEGEVKRIEEKVAVALASTPVEMVMAAPSVQGQALVVSTERTKNRKKQRAVCCPIVYGSIAFYLGPKASDEYRTHEWTLFVRGARGEDLTYFIDKVVFKLHPSFAQPVREVREPPFEVTEKGWGEFEAAIRLHFKDPTERPVELSHIVKLYDSGLTEADPNQGNPVLSQVYDEVVFAEPYEDFYNGLITDTREDKKPNTTVKAHPLQKYFGSFDDADDLELLLRASEYVKQHLESVKDAVYRLDHQIGVAKQMDQNRAAEASKTRQIQQQQQHQAQQNQAPPNSTGSAGPPRSSQQSHPNLQASQSKAQKGITAAPASLHAAQPITAANLGTAQHMAAAAARNRASVPPAPPTATSLANAAGGGTGGRGPPSSSSAQQQSHS